MVEGDRVFGLVLSSRPEWVVPVRVGLYSSHFLFLLSTPLRCWTLFET